MRQRRPPFTFIDLFAGIGGMRLGFEAVGGKCVFASELDKFARQTYGANFIIDHDFAGDIREVPASSIPAHDVLLAGFPCQPFSIAGIPTKNSLGMPHGFRDSTRGTLFFDIARILEYRRPKAFLLENVKNLRSHDRGRTFRIILGTLQELGYRVQVRIINAKGFVPQNRERIFIVGFREDTGFEFDAVEIPAADDGPKLWTILHPEDGSEDAEPPYTIGVRAVVSPKYTLTPKTWNWLQRHAQRHRARGNGFGFGLVGPYDVARTLSARYYKDGSEILIRRSGRPHNFQDDPPRRLTPRECARLMGFDGPNESKFVIPVSDTQAYKQFGNAVVVPVVKALAQAMLPYVCNEGTETQKRSWAQDEVAGWGSCQRGEQARGLNDETFPAECFCELPCGEFGLRSKHWK